MKDFSRNFIQNDRDTIKLIEELGDWFLEYSTRVTSTIRYIVFAVFASAWLFLINEGLRGNGTWILFALLILSFIYVTIDIVRYLFIAAQVRMYNKDLNKLRDSFEFELVEKEKTVIRKHLEIFHEKSWKCLMFQIIMVVIMIILMAVYFFSFLK